jgi:hypothetical protein
MEISMTTTILLLIVIGFLVIYVGSRKYLEPFEPSVDNDYQGDRYHGDGTPNTNPNQKSNVTLPLPENMSTTRVDEYEISAVFQNQGSREASKQQINDAMSKYPIDWSTQGPNSQYFQENQVKYTKDLNYAAQPAPFSEQGLESAVAPSMEEEEQKILKTYQPKSSKDLLTYSVNDVKNMLDEVYSKKGLIPVIHKSKQGDHIWEVTEVKEKNPTIVWEDDTQSRTQQTMRQRGEETIEVPYPATDLAAGMNPFMNPRQRVGKTRHESPQWTPGVDRMFTPSYPIPEWN